MDWKRMSKREALVHLRNFDKGDESLKNMIKRVPAEYAELRNCLLAVYNGVDEKRKKGGPTLPKDYATDLYVGLALHEYLAKRGFGIWEAADDNVWRYIAVAVVPDLVHGRLRGEYEKDAFSGVRQSRFWVRNIWWYVHLSLVVDRNGKPDYKKTERILRSNDTDILAGVVDHQGSGFRVDFFRAMMSAFDDFCTSNKLAVSREDSFRDLIKEYQIRTAVVDPDLEGHARFLSEMFGKGSHLIRGAENA